ncbi:MAG: hypothetical protein ACFFD8_01480 [Candidatus Thorarchaeota archaeon]
MPTGKQYNKNPELQPVFMNYTEYFNVKGWQLAHGFVVDNHQS